MKSSLLLLLVPALSAAASAQTLTFTQIVGPDDAVRSHGVRPALDGEQVAFLGNDKATSDSGVYLAAADGTGTPLLVVDEHTPLPNVPGETFRFLDNPALHDGVATFTAGHQLLTSINDGIYQGSGGPVNVYYDHWNDVVTSPNPFAPLVDSEGLVFQSAGANSSGFLTNAQVYRSDSPETFEFAVTGALPGGGIWHSTSDPAGAVALGGGVLAVSADVNHPGGFDGGVYTRDATGGPVDLVANWDTPMPTTALLFENFWELDTDGVNVVFVGQSGFVGFGGHLGIYLAPVGASGAGPLTAVVERGDLGPGGQTLLGFGAVAIDGDLVVFEANFPGGIGVFGWRSGELFEILDSNSALDGIELGDVDFDARGLDGNRLALRVLYPITGGGLYPYGLYVVSIDEVVCQADLGSGGPGSSVLSVCGEALGAGNSATLRLEGAPPLTAAFLVVGDVQAALPILGGTLVPFPATLVESTATDVDGALSIPIIAGGQGPFTWFVQSVVLDLAQPELFGFSNAVAIELLP